MATVDRLLSALPQEAHSRILEWLQSRYDSRMTAIYGGTIGKIPTTPPLLPEDS
jgi:hypothetical protein